MGEYRINLDLVVSDIDWTVEHGKVDYYQSSHLNALVAIAERLERLVEVLSKSPQGVNK